MKNITLGFVKAIVVASAALSFSAISSADMFMVDANANCAGDGVANGLSTIALNAGDSFSVTSSTNDLWSLGALPRWCDADGLVHREANGLDDSGEVAGTIIGEDFGNLTLGSQTFRYGTMVATLDDATYFAVGSNYSGVAPVSGTLKLFIWDTPSGDNSNKITATVSSVPEPASMLALGLGAVALIRRRKNA